MAPTGPLPFGNGRPVLLCDVGPQSEFDLYQRFTEVADRRFFLEAPGHPTLKIDAGIGGVTMSDRSYIIIELGEGDWRDRQAAL